MTDQDQDKEPDLGKLGGKPAEEPVDVEGHATRAARTVDDEDDVEGHFSTVRSTRRTGE
jgi:hypothetical protein